MLGDKWRWSLIGMAALASLTSGCLFIGEYDDVYVEPLPQAILYEVCYDDLDCRIGFCEELAVPAGPYADYVNAICTQGCFDDLECPISEFNGLPGACIDYAAVGGPLGSTLCLERCEVDFDCDVANGFGCGFVTGQRVCIPVY
ncbi:MAG: hypothetical protein AAGF92_17190 [Myxococcota bacterium]